MEAILNFWQRLKGRPHIRRNSIFVGFLLIALMITYATIHQIDRNYQLQLQVDATDDQIGFLETEIETLRQEIEFYQTEYYIEMESKRRTGLSLKPEKVLIIPQSKVDQRWQQHQDSQPQSPPPRQLSNWKLWWRFFWGQNQPTPEERL